MPKLVLCADVPSLGRIGDVVQVKEGYARNYLLPCRLAMEPTPANLKKIEKARKEAEARRVKELEEKKELASRLEGFEVTIVSRANEQGYLFGSVGPKEIADALREEGYNIDPAWIQLGEHLKQVDKYTVPVRLGEDIECHLTLWVAPERTEEAGPTPTAEAAPAEDDPEGGTPDGTDDE